MKSHSLKSMFSSFIEWLTPTTPNPYNATTERVCKKLRDGLLTSIVVFTILLYVPMLLTVSIRTEPKYGILYFCTTCLSAIAGGFIVFLVQDIVCKFLKSESLTRHIPIPFKVLSMLYIFLGMSTTTHSNHYSLTYIIVCIVIPVGSFLAMTVCNDFYYTEVEKRQSASNTKAPSTITSDVKQLV